MDEYWITCIKCVFLKCFCTNVVSSLEIEIDIEIVIFGRNNYVDLQLFRHSAFKILLNIYNGLDSSV